MFIPARRSRGDTAVCTRLPRFLSVATAGVVTVGGAFGLVPVASAEPPPGQGWTMMIDIVGDSFTAGEGIRDTYIDPADQRHRSLVAPALQALSRLASDNPGLRVDADIVASSGAVTADFFNDQKGPDGRGGEAVVNPAQRDQVRPDTQVVIVGFGGNDAQFADVLANARPTADSPLDTRLKNLSALLDSAAADEEYLGQARASKPGRAPTLVARMLQVLAGVSARAPRARIAVTNYPLAVDPQNKYAASIVGERDLTSVRKFGHDVNAAIERAVRICRCATLVDMSGAVAGHEAYTSDSVFNERPAEQSQRELFHPNQKGASLMANPIAMGIARLLGINTPAPSDGTITIPKNIKTRTGVPDRDGDTVPDPRDRAPDDPTRSEAAAKPAQDPKPKHPKAKRTALHNTPSGKPTSSDRGRHSPATVSAVIAKVVDSVTPPHNQGSSDRPVPEPAPPAPAPTGADDGRHSVAPAAPVTKPDRSRVKKSRPAVNTPPTCEPAKQPAGKRITGKAAPKQKANLPSTGLSSRQVKNTQLIPAKAGTAGVRKVPPSALPGTAGCELSNRGRKSSGTPTRNRPRRCPTRFGAAVVDDVPCGAVPRRRQP